MADSSHLEKMGRELKCPICLSLLNSAVSLTCNHVFCHSCIHKSMRSGSNCPVCKVPYQRREIRPAAHMDNLVNIYKSMEVASGLSLFVSQKTPATKMADAEILANGELDTGRKTGEEISGTANRKRMKGVSSTKAKLKRKSSGRASGKSSFATNKRVQVPQSPITETPVRQGKDEHNGNTVTINPLNKCSAISIEHLLSINQESSHLSPLFWVREVERRSQQTDVEPLTGTPVKAPSFSDLKDSDDEVPPEVSEPHSKCNADFFDSEMFEWTQRACSPELCSNPAENQVGDTEDDIMLGQKSVEVSRDASKNGTMIIEQPANASPQKNMDNELHNNGYPGRNIEDSISAPRFTCNKGVNERNESQKTFIKFKTKTQESNDCLETPSDFMQCQGPDNKVVQETSKVFGTSETRHVQSLHPRLINEGDNHVPELPVPPERREANHKDKKLGNSKREFNSIEHNHESVSVKRKKQVKNSTCIIGGKSNSSKLLVEIPNKDVSKSKRCSTSKPKEICELTSVFQQMVSLNGTSKKNMTDEGENVQEKSTHNVKRSLKKGKLNEQNIMLALHKCNTNGIKCAFCHSMEETEDSGQIVHYSEGKPVLATQTGASVIHSHKSCTEWAPNVYFEDDIAVNLEEELTRSRRIKCSLCGVKGAALGCYEKSCRRSFHVPCAKKLKECRWDTDHFVILCPLHASLKLPSEMPTQEVRKGKCDYKGRQRSEVAVRQSAVRQSHSLNKWFCGQPTEKIVICCSALATADKEAVSELAKSAGAVVLGSWNASVTHVIASTNEDGSCKRTLKVLMGILDGKWVLNIKWVQACMEAKRLVEEAPYEITCIHGYENGPRLGRLRLLNQQPKLFSGFKFYFVGEFEPSYKGYLQDLVTTAGGTVLHRKPIPESNGTGMPSSSTVIVYSIELPGNCDRHKKDMLLNQRQYNAQALANSSGAKIASNSWILDSITGHKLQDL